MRQIKEKAPAAPASVTSANHNNQVKDTTKKLIRQAECASEVSQTYPAKATYQISEYLEYCDCVGKQPNQRLSDEKMVCQILEAVFEKIFLSERF